MELLISHTLVKYLTEFESLLTSLPKSNDHETFYKKQARDVQVTDLLTLAASIELPLSVDDAKVLLDEKEQRNIPQNQKYLRNCLAGIRYSKSLREHGFNTAVVQQLNKLLADGFSDFWEEGKVRAVHETPSYTHDGLRNRPTNPDYQLWTDIRQLLSYQEEAIHPILLAGITVYHLVYSYPFLQANLQTAILSAYGAVKATKYSALGTLSIIETTWKVLQKTDFTFEPSPAHFTQFMEKLLRDYTKQLEIVHDAISHRTSIAPHIRASLNDRQLKVLTYFKQHKKLTRKKYSKMMNIAIATAFRDLNDLTGKGLIKSVGKGRGTSYILAQLPTPGELPNHDNENVPNPIIDDDVQY